MAGGAARGPALAGRLRECLALRSVFRPSPRQQLGRRHKTLAAAARASISGSGAMAAWVRLPVTTPPCARGWSSLSLLDNRMLVFGGDAGGNVFLNDLYVFQFQGKGTRPSPRPAPPSPGPPCSGAVHASQGGGRHSPQRLSPHRHARGQQAVRGPRAARPAHAPPDTSLAATMASNASTSSTCSKRVRAAALYVALCVARGADSARCRGAAHGGRAVRVAEAERRRRRAEPAGGPQRDRRGREDLCVWRQGLRGRVPGRLVPPQRRHAHVDARRAQAPLTGLPRARLPHHLPLRPVRVRVWRRGRGRRAVKRPVDVECRCVHSALVPSPTACSPAPPVQTHINGQR